MKDLLKGTSVFIIAIAVIIGLSYGFGWIGVNQTLTIGKAQQNANRVVFEQTQSYVEGKRQSALKYYKEYQSSTDEQKQSLKYIIAQDFANFDEDVYLSGDLRNFIHNCKY